jgi:hypothetical protein
MLSDEFLAEMRSEFPAFRLVPKANSALSKCIDVALRVVTAGSQRRYMTHYHTVIGATLYVPSSWSALPDLERVILLRHERVHLRQRRRYGMALMAFLYLVPFFPLGLAWFRARMEWEAYTETLRATAELRGLDAMRDGDLRRRIVERFTGGDYGWMWPFPRQVERWYDSALREIETALAAVPQQLSGSTHAGSNGAIGLTRRSSR